MSPTENALYVLNGVEDGKLDHEKTAKYMMELDPVIVFFLVKFLRDKYPPSNPASSGVIERLVLLLSTHPSVLTRSKAGERDAVTEWFLDSYDLKSYFRNPDQMFQILFDKLDG